MATVPTNNPIPSEDPRDLKFNAGKIDEVVTSDSHYYTDRFGKRRLTIAGFQDTAEEAITEFKHTAEEAIRNYGYITMDSFEDGATLTLPNQVLRYEATGEYYRWDGAFPVSGKVVPSGSTPTSTGGIGVGAWLSVGDATLRGQLYSSSLPGTSLIKHSDGRTLQEELNSILSVHSRVFSVDDPQFAGGAKGDSDGTVGNGTDDTAAIYACFQAAIAAGGGKIVFSPGKIYRTTYTVLYGSNMVVDGQGAEIFHDSNTTNGSAFQPATFQSYTDFTENVIFMNLIVSGPVGRGNGIGANRARHITLFNVGSNYLHWHLWDGAGCQFWKVVNCWSKSTNSAAFQVDVSSYPNASEASDAAGNILPISYDAAGTAGWSYGYDCLIEGCTVRNAKYCGISLHNTGNRNIRIVNNYLEDCDSGILADDNATHVTLNTQIVNNTFIRCRIPINWRGGYDRLSITENNFYGTNTNDWYYGIFLKPYSQTQTTLKVDNNFFNGIIRPIIINGANGFSINNNIFHTCGGTTAPSSGGLVSVENPLAILRASGCQSGTISDNVFQNCLTPVCISVARNEVDSTYSVSVEVTNNISRGSGCLLSLYYADRCTVRDNKYVGLATDFYGIYAASSCIALVLEGTYISQGTGRGIYLDGGARHVVRDNVLFSSGTDYAIWLGNCTSPRSSGNIITGGYAATQVTIGGTTTGAVLDEAFATTGKAGTATGVAVTYTTAAV